MRDSNRVVRRYNIYSCHHTNSTQHTTYCNAVHIAHPHLTTPHSPHLTHLTTPHSHHTSLTTHHTSHLTHAAVMSQFVPFAPRVPVMTASVQDSNKVVTRLIGTLRHLHSTRSQLTCCTEEHLISTLKTANVLYSTAHWRLTCCTAQHIDG